MTMGRLYASPLRQEESYLKDTGMGGPASASAMARRLPNVYRRKVDAAIAAPVYAPIPDSKVGVDTIIYGNADNDGNADKIVRL